MALKQQIEISAKDKTKAAANSVKKSLGGVSSAAQSMGAQLGLAFGIGGMGFAIKQSLDAADKIQKLSIRLGASTEGLSQYKHVAELSGVSIETLTMGWQRMTRRVAEAAQGTGEARGALDELGISAQSLNQLAPEDQFEVLAEAISKVDNQADKVRLSMKLFDSEGVSLLQTMEGGAKGIQDMRKEADRLGLTLSRGQVDAAAKANDAMTVLNGSFTAIATNLAVNLAPAITSLVNSFNDLMFGSDTKEELGEALIAASFGAEKAKTNLDEVTAAYERAKSAAEAGPGALSKFFGDDKSQELVLSRNLISATKDKTAAELEFAIALQRSADIKAAIERLDEEKPEKPSGKNGKSVITDIFGTEEEMQDDMDRALELIDKQFEQLDEATARGIAGLGKVREKGNKDELTDEQKLQNQLTAMAQSGNKSALELVRNHAIEKAKVYAIDAVAAAYAWGAKFGPIGGAAAAAAASLAIGGIISKLSNAGQGADAPAATVSSVPSTDAPIPVEDTTAPASVNVVIPTGLHSDNDMRALVERLEEVRQDMGGNVQFVTEVR